MKINTYRELVVWQRAMQLVEDTYKATRDFPREERYGLCSQLQRSAISIPSNIAEGHERRSTAEFLRFMAFALGSIAEVETQVLLAQRLNYLPEAGTARLLDQADQLGRMMRAMHRTLRARVQQAPLSAQRSALSPSS